MTRSLFCLWCYALIIELAPHVDAAPAPKLVLDPQQFAFAAKAAEQVTPLINSVGFSARFTETEAAFRTTGVEKVEPQPDGAQRVTFRLEGPAAATASVTCDARQVSEVCVRLTWKIAYTGPVRSFFGWGDGLSFAFAGEPKFARARPMVKWVAPTGAKPWEVVGDTPYAALDRQLREVQFGASRLIFATSWYDSDWFYNHELARVHFMRLGLPAKAPQETTATTEVVLAGPEMTDEEALATALGEPIAVQIGTGRPGNVFAPGETLQMPARLRNVSANDAAATLRWGLYDYYGKAVVSGNAALNHKPGEAHTLDLARKAPARQGIYFLAGDLQWPGGSRALRTTLGVLPQRTSALRPESPFGVSGIICNPGTYPDQPDIDTVLGLCARIGVHWVRSFGFPVREDVKPEEIAAAHQRLDTFRKYGMSAHVQCAQGVPADAAATEAFRRAFTAALPQFSFISPHIELGNELNGGAKAADCISRLFKPQFEVMRQQFPEGKVMNFGLAGVPADWWADFVKSGGLDYIDAISVHPGHHPRAPEFWEGWDGWVWRPQMQRVFGALDKLGLRNKREVWVTEAYAPSTPERSQLDARTAADYLVREYVLSLALGVRCVEWYQFQDGTWFSAAPNPEDNEFNYGMTYTDLAPKPQYIAFGTMTAQLEGAKCLGRLQLGADDLYGIRFRQQDGPVDVLWSYREKNECDLGWWPPEKFKNDHRKPGEPWIERWRKPVQVTLAANGPVEVTDLIGTRRTINPIGGKVTLSLTGSPVYVRGLAEMAVQKEVWAQN
jgi:hypothetical protein